MINVLAITCSAGLTVRAVLVHSAASCGKKLGGFSTTGEGQQRSKDKNNSDTANLNPTAVFSFDSHASALLDANTHILIQSTLFEL